MFPQRPSLVICSDLMVQLLYIHDAAALRGAERRRGVSVDTFRDLRREKRGGGRISFFFFFFSPTVTIQLKRLNIFIVINHGFAQTN